MSARVEENNLIDENALLTAIAPPNGETGRPENKTSLRERLGLVPASTESARDEGGQSAPPTPANRDVEVRNRDLRVVAKVLEYNLQHLDSAEEARDAARRALAKVQEELERAGGALHEALGKARSGEPVQDLDRLFDRNLEALERLEKVAGEAAVAISWNRTAWRIFAQSKREEEIIRSAMDSTS